jgi:hypothetical protein
MYWAKRWTAHNPRIRYCALNDDDQQVLGVPFAPCVTLSAHELNKVSLK